MVLTGAARGLGLAFADALAEAGANIAVLDVGSPGDNLDKLRNKHGVKVEFYKTDVTSREQVTDSIERIEKEFGTVDIKLVTYPPDFRCYSPVSLVFTHAHNQLYSQRKRRRCRHG